MVLKILVASIGIFFLLTTLTRLIGKKLLSQMTYYDLAVTITIGTISGAYVTSIADGPVVLLSPLILALCAIITGYVTARSRTLSKWIEGEPIIVIQNGKILERNMVRARYDMSEMQAQLRIKGVFNLNDIEFAILEPQGQLSVLKKSQKLPITASDLNMPTKYQGLASELVVNGSIIEQNLLQNRLSKEWLRVELCRRGIEDINKVALVLLNTDGSLYIDIHEDQFTYIQEVEDSMPSKERDPWNTH